MVSRRVSVLCQCDMMQRVSHDTLDDSLRGASAPEAELTDHLFIALESSRPLAGSSRHTLRNIDEICIGRGPRRTWQRVETGGLRQLLLQVPDPRMSVTHARLRRAAPTVWELTDCGSRNGSWLAGQRVESARLSDRALFELGHTFFTLRSLVTPARTLGDLDGLELHPVDPAFATLLPELHESFADLARIARSRLSVLLLGETGAGKEWLARAVHAVSGRHGEFVAVNCAALPPSLLEAQLFGHVKGAFSGADRNQIGFVRAAHEGTLFLDEIADLPLASQAALLRVLQEQEVTPVGSTRPIAVDLRVVAATHAAIERRVAEGSFRADLFARLDGFRFTAPALRQRREDFGLLVASILNDPAVSELGPMTFHPELSRLLLEYDWPRNIRELRQDLIAAAVLAAGEPIALCHLRKSLIADAEPMPLDPISTVAPRAIAAPDFDDPFERELRERLESNLQECDGNLSEVARRMGKARTQVQRWMKRFALDRRRYRGGEGASGP
jgi:transcriptional regulator of acetoin/glycerol metabolism